MAIDENVKHQKEIIAQQLKMQEEAQHQINEEESKLEKEEQVFNVLDVQVNEDELENIDDI